MSLPHIINTFTTGRGIARSIDLLGKKEYNYVYEDGNVVRAAEYNIAVNADEIVIAKHLIHSIIYAYDTNDRLSIKRIVPETGTEQVTEKHQMYGKVKGTATTQLVQQIVMGGYNMFTYWYDEEGRIAGYSDLIMGGREYTYDALGQLIKETGNGATNDMTYDNYGNILSKNGITYTYGDSVWKDKLTAYGDQTITYDAQGNPVSYLGHALTWEKGRQLKSFDNIQYTYNANGIRTSKTVDGVKHTYMLDGTKILSETWGENTLIPLYDNEDSVCGIFYNNVPYYFYKNLQGDVIAITDPNGSVMAQYTYDAWGVCSIYSDNSGCNLANVNPFRYRGYYYDAEIGLYYVSSRYYDSEIGRFLNSDEITYLGADSTVLSYNLYTYCENEPTNNEDRSGNWLLRVICGVAAGTVFGGVALAICTLLKLTKKQKTYISRAFTALGVLLGTLLGVKILTKVAPQLIKWFRKIEKNIAFSFKGKECKVGVELFHLFKIMIHRPHTKSLHKYNPIGWHIQFEIKWLGRWIVVFRIKIDTVVKWYQSMK